MHQGNISVLSILFILAVIFLFSVFFLQQKSSSNLPIQTRPSSISNIQTSMELTTTTRPPTSPSATLSPTETVQKYYQEYIRCSKIAIQTKSQTECNFIIPDYVADQLPGNLKGKWNGDYNPIFCSISVPDSVTVIKEQINKESTAQIIMNINVNTTVNTAHVILEQANGLWKIDNIICPPT